MRRKAWLRACLSKQFQWVDRIGWARGAHRLCADRHSASTEQVLFGSGPPPRAGWILRHWCNSLKSITQTGSEAKDAEEIADIMIGVKKGKVRTFSAIETRWGIDLPIHHGDGE